MGGPAGIPPLAAPLAFPRAPHPGRPVRPPRSPCASHCAPCLGTAPFLFLPRPIRQLVAHLVSIDRRNATLSPELSVDGHRANENLARTSPVRSEVELRPPHELTRPHVIGD